MLKYKKSDAMSLDYHIPWYFSCYLFAMKILLIHERILYTRILIDKLMTIVIISVWFIQISYNIC